MNLTKREQFAMAAMQGLCAGDMEFEYVDDCAKMAVKCADALIAELDRTTGEN